MNKEKIEARLRYKSRTVWLTAVLWALVSGVFFYLLFVPIGFMVTYAILFILTFVLIVFVGHNLKVTNLLFRNIIIFPLCSAVSVILNHISPQWYSTNEVGFAIAHYMFLMIGTLFVCIGATQLVRLTVGFEAMPTNPLRVFSYLVECETSDTATLMKDFLEYIEAKSSKSSHENNQTQIGFTKYLNDYVVSINQKDKLAELDFVTYQFKHDTVIEANKEDMDIFFGVFDGVLNKWKESGKIESWGSHSEPKYAEETKKEVLQAYTSSRTLHVPFPSKEIIKQRIVGWLRRNKTEIIRTLISGIIMVIIAQILIRFFFP